VLAVSCTTTKGVDTLKLFIGAIVKRELETFEPRIPTPWLELEKYVIEVLLISKCDCVKLISRMLQEKYKRVPPLMSWEEFSNVATYVNIKGEKEIK